ncbi:MAG: RidA family protein [Phycisphaerae bacterium]|nr:RidA family protein [Phycisphaerae bacterium]
MTRKQKINRLGFELPGVAEPIGSYVPALRTGNLVFTAGQIPTRDGKLIAAGKVPTDVSLQEAQAAARQCVLNALAAVEAEIGSLDDIVRIVRLNVFVNSAPGFTDQAKVANGASDLLLDIFSEAGRHTRCAVGAAELPLGAPVELDLIVQIR